MPLLQVEFLTKRFYIDHLQREIEVFSDLTFALEAGQFMLIGGANGAGKSSLLRCLFRTYIPTSGRAYLTRRGGRLISPRPPMWILRCCAANHLAS